jgi:hypothetical protein
MRLNKEVNQNRLDKGITILTTPLLQRKVHAIVLKVL